MEETGGEGPRRLAGQNRLRLIGMGFVASSTRGYTLRGNDPLFALPRAG